MSRIDLPDGVDLHVNGRISADYMTLPPGAVVNASLPGTEQLDATKLRHYHYATYEQESGTTTTTGEHTIHVARFAGNLLQFVVGNVVACIGAATITVDVFKNGATVLSSLITLDNTNTARIVETATIDPAKLAYVAGDWFEIQITATAGGGTLGKGFFAKALFDEQSQ